MKRPKSFMHKLCDYFAGGISERNDRENITLDAIPTVQVDMRTRNIQKDVRKSVDQQLKQVHQFASIAHAPDCHVIHPTDPSLDCRRPDCHTWQPDEVVGTAYEVELADDNATFYQLSQGKVWPRSKKGKKIRDQENLRNGYVDDELTYPEYK